MDIFNLLYYISNQESILSLLFLFFIYFYFLFYLFIFSFIKFSREWVDAACQMYVKYWHI